MSRPIGQVQAPAPQAAQSWIRGRAKQAGHILGMIKFEHTVFALPFALIGMLLAAQALPARLPAYRTAIWILTAMVAARSMAMAFNRLVDSDLDSRNPRTANRHIPAGLLARSTVWLFVLASAGLFELAAFELNQLCFVLSPIALCLVCAYSFTKRFTSLCHIVLGVAIGLAPLGAWIAVQGRPSLAAVLLAVVVTLWIGGFDIIYSLLDFDFDSREPLFSLPKRLGKTRALWVSRAMHAAMVVLLLIVGYVTGRFSFYYAGVAVVTALIGYEHYLVKPHDLSRVNTAFFTVNGWVSVTLLAFVTLDCTLR